MDIFSGSKTKALSTYKYNSWNLKVIVPFMTHPVLFICTSLFVKWMFFLRIKTFWSSTLCKSKWGNSWKFNPIFTKICVFSNWIIGFVYLFSCQLLSFCFMDMHCVIMFVMILTNDTISSLGATQSPERQSPWCDQLQHPTTQSRQVEDLDLGDGDDYGIDGDHNYDGGDHDHDGGDHEHDDLDDSFYGCQDWGPWRNLVCPRWRIPGQNMKRLQYNQLKNVSVSAPTKQSYCTRWSFDPHHIITIIRSGFDLVLYWNIYN